MSKVLITTVPFGKGNPLPIEMLENAGAKYLINPFNVRLKENQLIDLIKDFDIIIAGTEPITKLVMESAKRLKLISRVGIGLDNVDLVHAKKLGIRVSYTPEAPAPAVAELTIGLMFSLLRSIHVANLEIHKGIWKRHYGRRIPEVTIGIIGVGRIGTRVLNQLMGFGTPKILVNDISPNPSLDQEYNLSWVTKEQIFREADLISLHLPLTSLTKDMVCKEQLMSMKSNALLINTSRGGIINEGDLYSVMKSGHLAGAAIDVYNEEPYEGPLKDIERCLLTAHMGSMSVDCRARMEITAAEEAVRFLNDKNLQNEVPKEEYNIQMLGM